MATAIHRVSRAGNEIKLEAGISQTFALKYITGKNLGNSDYPPYMPRVLFTAVDDRKLFVDAEDGSAIELRLRELGVRPADFITATWIKHPRGGGHSIRIELAEETRLEADLRKSVQRATGATRRLTWDESEKLGMNEPASAPERPSATPAAPETPKSHQEEKAVVGVQPDVPQTNGSASEKRTMCKLLTGALIASIDAYALAGDYAKSKGFPIIFGSEDIRTSANSMLIEFWRGGGR